MSKYYGGVGFATEVTEVRPGIYEESIIERKYYGDIDREYRRLENASQKNDNISLSNVVSIIADAYATENYSSIRYITYMGVRWKADSVEVQYPRMIISLGGKYNGKPPTTTT